MPSVAMVEGDPLKQQALKHSRILVIDDDPLKVKLVTELLRLGGFSQFKMVTDSAQAVCAFTRFEPDLVILDLHMSPMNGLQLLREFRSMQGPNVYVPVLVLTGDVTRETKESVLEAGANDYLAKPFNGTEIVLRARNLLHTRHLYVELESERSLLEQRVKERTEELTFAHSEMLDRLALVTDYRDDSTGAHIRRVSEHVRMLALELGLPLAEAELFGKAALLHDLGKISIPDSILLKPGSLTREELDLIKTHTRTGSDILKNSNSAVLKVAERIARFHHERWDGTGYEGLRRSSIPLEARICAVADVFDALRATRPYKAGWKHGPAVAEISRLGGSHFDPEVVRAFIRIEQDLIPLYENCRTVQAALGRNMAQQDPDLVEPEAQSRHGRVQVSYDSQFVQIAREGFWMVDRHWRTVMVNPRLCELLGYAQEDMLGKHVIDFYFPEDHQKVLDKLVNREHGKEDRYVVRYRRNDGSELWAEISVKPRLDNAGQFDGAIAVLVDVGDKVAAERELRATQELLKTSVEVLDLGFWNTDIETRHMVWTRELEVLFGFVPGSYDGSFESFYERIHPEDREQVRAAYERSIETRETYTFDYRVRTEDGSWRWIGARGRVIAGADGRSTRSVGVAVSIDEYKKLEMQLLQSQRLESAGRLVSSVAHDFNNFLGAIGGYTELAQRSIHPDSEAAQYLKIVEDAGTRAVALVKKLLMFACHRISAPQSIDLNVLTTGLRGILSSVVGDKVKLVMNVDEGELFVRIDPVQYEQVILNLAANARDAMPEGGTLTISTGMRGGSRLEDKLVVVTVEDSGTGMDSAIKERIFDPFFTTKDPAKGSGLGLSTCSGIVKSADGQVLVSSVPGLGSKFELLFPLARPVVLQKCA